MKLRAGTLNGTIAEWNKHLSTCYYDSNRCNNYFIPITTATAKDLYWYVDTLTQVSSVEHRVINYCTGASKVVRPRFHLYGVNEDADHYGVINGLNSLPYETFVIAVKVTYTSGSTQWFYSEVYEREDCAAVDMVFACYNKNDNGGYDANNIYTGEPTTTHIGNPLLRYYHNYTLRGLKSLYSGKKITFTALNYKPVKATQSTNVGIYYEAIPYWYEQYTSQSFAKGVVVIDDIQYTLLEYSSQAVGDPCCELVSSTIVGGKTITTTYSCSSDLCEALVCNEIVLPDFSLGVPVCFDEATFTKVISMTGTAPINYEIVDDGAYTVSITNTQITITGPSQTGQIHIKLWNCGSDLDLTWNIIDGPCCELGTINLEDLRCGLGNIVLTTNPI
jgi:hypothetical protein